MAAIKVTIKQPPKISVRLGATVVRSSDNQMIALNFSETTVYHVGDYVVYRSGLYKAIEDDIVGQWNPAQWFKTNVAEAKQDVIEDLGKIRHGAELGETALQEVPDEYRTGAEQDIIDATKYSSTNPPPYPVTSVNGKTDAAVLSAEDVGALPASTTIPTQLSQLSGDSTHRTVTDSEKSGWNNKYSKPAAGIPAADLAESVQDSLDLAGSALQSESDPTVPTWAKQPNKPSYTASEISDNGTTVAAEISDIKGKISSQATSTNKLVSESEMGDAIAAVEAKQLYSNTTQGQFATKAALTGATKYYNADGTEATPTKNDVAYVLADESHDGKSAKYVIASVSGTSITWGFVITFSTSTFSQAQMDAINSGITSTKREGYDTHVGNGDIHVTAAQKTAWSGKQDAISDLATIRAGAALGATAVQPKAGKGLFSGSYNDLTNKPTIPTVTVTDVGIPIVTEINGATIAADVDTSGSALATAQMVFGKENTSNKTTSISSSSTDTQYPTAKAVYSFIQSLDGNGVSY